MSGLATDYRHPELSQIQRDSEGKEVTMDNYQMLPDWNGTVVSKEDPIPDDERPPKRTTDPFPPGSVIPDKNSLQNNVEKPEKEIAEACEKKEKQALVKAKTKRIASLCDIGFLHRATHSYHSKPKDIDDEEADANRFIPGWRLENDLQIDSDRELKDMEREMDEWRQNSSNQVEKIKKLEEDLGTKSKQLINVEHRVHALQKEKEDLVARLAQSEMNRQSVVKDFILTAISMLQTSVEYQKSLDVPVSLSYIASWLGDLGLGQTEEEIAKILLNINN
ncbi:hypothetical protein Tco_0400528, partial [Tanacetum coccineum]